VPRAPYLRVGFVFSFRATPSPAIANKPRVVILMSRRIPAGPKDLNHKILRDQMCEQSP